MADIKLPPGRNNAIASVLFTIELDRELSKEEVAAVDQRYPEFKKELPRRNPSQGVMFRFSVGGTPEAEQVDNPNLVGMTYEYVHPDGSVEKGLKLEKNLIQVIHTRYDRWQTTWPVIEHLMLFALSEVLNTRKVVSVSTRYQDEFHYEGDYNEFSAEMIFRRENSFLPNHVFGRTLNWHAHTGWFDENESPSPHRLLNNLNVDVIDGSSPNTRTLRINLLHRMMFPEQFDKSLIEEYQNVTLSTLFRFIHDRDKDILRDVLNENTAERIRLQ